MPGKGKPGRKPRVSDRNIMSIFRDCDEPVLSTAEVCEQLPIKRRATLNRLRQLEDLGMVRSKTIGGRNTVWWVTEAIAESGLSESVVGDAPVADDPPEEPAIEPTETWGETEEPDAFAELDLPGSGGTLQRRQDAVRTACEYLEEHGSAKTRDVREHVWQHSQTGYSDANSMWKNCVYKGLKQVAETDPNLHPPGEGEHTWSYGG